MSKTIRILDVTSGETHYLPADTCCWEYPYEYNYGKWGPALHGGTAIEVGSYMDYEGGFSLEYAKVGKIAYVLSADPGTDDPGKLIAWASIVLG